MTADLAGVWGSGPSDVWAVGGIGTISTILHWDGSAWTSIPSGTTDRFLGVWGSGASDVWAVGAGGTIRHWDGCTCSTARPSRRNVLPACWGGGGGGGGRGGAGWGRWGPAGPSWSASPEAANSGVRTGDPEGRNAEERVEAG